MQGVLLVNLGSPDSPNSKDVKKYLDEFLMDKRVIDVPYLLRAFLVKGIILNTRPKKSAKAYKKIWTDEGSPLIVNSEHLKDKLQQSLDVPVALGMRYGSISIKKGLQELKEKGVDEVLMIPMYPQFAMSSVETVVEKTKEVQKKYFKDIKIEVLPAFYNNDDYIDAITNLVKAEQNNVDDFLLFSYHGLPESHIKKADITASHCKIDGTCCNTPSEAHEFCYRHQCYKTTEKMVAKLGLKEGQYTTSFQSRLGRDPWLQPFTNETLKELASTTKNIKVVTPTFVADCLETLEEMEMENRAVFQENGGETYQVLSCLNDNNQWVSTLKKWCEDWMQNKPEGYLKLS